MSTIDLGALADGIMPRDPSDHGYLERIAQGPHRYGVPMEIARTDIALAYMHGYSAGLVAGVQHDVATAPAEASQELGAAVQCRSAYNGDRCLDELGHEGAHWQRVSAGRLFSWTDADAARAGTAA